MFGFSHAVWRRGSFHGYYVFSLIFSTKKPNTEKRKFQI